MRHRPGLVPRLPRDAWVVLTGDAMSAVGSGLTLPFLLVYLARARHIDLSLAGLAVSTIALAALVGNPSGGWLTDRLGPRAALVCGLATAAVGAFLIAGVHSTKEAFVAAAVSGVGAGAIVPSQDALLAVVVDPAQRSAVFAVRNATLNAGYGVGAMIAALVADLTHPSTFVVLYVLDGLTFLAFVPILWLLLPGVGRRPVAAGDTSDTAGTQGYAAVLADRTFLRFCGLIALLVTVGFAQNMAAFPLLANPSSGLTASVLGLAFAVNTCVVVVAQLPVLRLLEGRRRTTGVMCTCALWGMAWSLTWLAGHQSGAAAGLAVCVAVGIFGLGETFLAPSQAALANDLASDQLRGRYNAVYTLAWTTGLLVGPAVSARALDLGHSAPLYAGLVAGCGLAAVGARRLHPRLPRDLDLVSMPNLSASGSGPDPAIG